MSSNVSLADRPPKFHLKKSFHSGFKDADLDKAIKKHNVRSFIKNGIGPMTRTYETEGEENYGLQNHLDQLKKSCSKVSLEIKFKEEETNKCKDETMFKNDKLTKMKQNREKLENRIIDLQKKLAVVTNKKQITSYSCKSYEHILERMKKDDITMQLNKNLLEKQIRGLEKNYFMLQHKHSNISEFQKMSSAGLKDGQHELDEQKFYLSQHMDGVKKQSQNKIEQTNKLKQRQKQTEQIQELAADNIQDADLIKLKKFMTAQLFLRQVLKSKILKLKNYYQPHEKAFFKIKSNTSVKDANSLKVQFFNFESSYSEKTAWVKHLQEEIAEAEGTKKKLEQKLHENRMEEMDIIQKIQIQQKIKPDTKIRDLNEKSLQYELCYERIQTWVMEQVKKMNISSNSQNMEDQFKAVLNNLKGGDK